MSPAETGSAPAHPLRSLLGGAMGALISVAIVLTLGVVAFAPLGPTAVAAGVVAAFTCAVLSAAVYALAGHSVMPAGGPSSATALLAASLMAQVVGTAGAAPPAVVLTQAIVCLAAAVCLMGALQLLMAALRVGSLVRVVPQPVLGGFMNGIALLILLSQLPALLALPPGLWQAEGWRAVGALQPGALALGAGTAALVWLLQWRAPRWPGALLALLAGVAVYHLLHRWWPAAALGPTLGSIEPAGTLPGLLALLNGGAAQSTALGALQQHAGLIALTAALMATIATLESMLNVRVIDQHLGLRHDQRRELQAIGLANLIGGPLGALPMAHVRARANSILQVGGRNRAGALGAVLASALLITVGAGAIAALPQVVLAGVMLTIGVALTDRASARLLPALRQGPRRRAVATSLAIMLLVCGLTVWRGPAVGVAAGMLLATIAFVHSMNRSLLRGRRDGLAQPSRRVYPPQLGALVQAARQRIVVLELEGALFFGSAERLADEAEALDPGCRFVVLDLRRISTVDDSAATALVQLQLRLARRNTALLLAGVTVGSLREAQLRAAGGHSGAGLLCFVDSDRAVEHAERQLLTEAGATDVSGSLPLEQSSLMHALSATQIANVTQHLQPRALRAGERLFGEGDAADGLYVLTQGSVSVISAGGQRFVSFSPATMLGELAMLDGQGRSASAVADSDAVVHLLTCDALAQLAQEDPPLCALLYRNIAVHLAQRLRVASDAWRGAAG